MAAATAIPRLGPCNTGHGLPTSVASALGFAIGAIQMYDPLTGLDDCRADMIAATVLSLFECAMKDVSMLTVVGYGG